MPEPDPRLTTIVGDAVALPEAGRAAYLDRACGGDAGLRARVDALLAALAGAGRFLDPGPDPAAGTGTFPAGGPPTAPFDGDARPPTGTVLGGRYKLVEPIGEGGMGAVWSAQQTEPVRRAVAVKVVKAGMDSKAVLARFDAERQALALMDHPNIAKVLDAGAHGGRPYFVMELVKGVPITDYCDRRKLTPRERLELFVPVCQAIQHAHQKGIIHRDIKPSNVLVALYDDRPVPKVIDFGVAKATGGALTERTLDTGFGGVVGTPQYMSPEQATFNNLDIDTRSDVYALGVLLYELLTGSPPFSKKELEQKGLLEILRVVREEEPPRPSTKLSTAAALPTVSANRGTEPKRLTGLLRNELDWIVMKALEKDRTRRYETANGFAADVLRYLSGEAVQAHPPSRGYRLKKFVRRNKGQVMAAGLVFFVLLVGIAGTTWGLIEAKRQESIARDEAAAKEGARQAEAEQRTLAESNERKAVAAADAERIANEQTGKRLAQIEKGNAILASVFDDLDILKVKKGNEPLEAVLARRLVLAGKQLDGESVGDPLVVASLQGRLGVTLLSLGFGRDAVPLLESAHATQSAKLGEDHIRTLGTMSNLASAYHAAGRLDEALRLHGDNLTRTKARLGPDHPATLWAMNNLTVTCLASGKLDLARPLIEEALSIQKVTLGPDHFDTLTSMNNLATCHLAAHRPDLAAPLLEAIFETRKAKIGSDHPDTLIAMLNLATAYQNDGRADLAVRLNEEGLKLRKAKLGADHPDTLMGMNNLAMTYKAVGKPGLAIPLLQEALKLQKAKLGADHPDTLVSMNSLATAHWAMKQLDKSIPLFEETLRLQEAKNGRNHHGTLLNVANLGVNYRDAGRVREALPLLEEAYEGYKRYPSLRFVVMELLQAYDWAGEDAKFARLLSERMPEARTALSNQRPLLAGLLAKAGLCLLEQKKWADAETVLRECLTIREKFQPDHWTTFNTRSLSGGALLGQEKYADAEPFLLEGYEGMKAREKAIPPQGRDRIPEALDRLVELYARTGKSDEVAKWRAERAKYPFVAPPPRAAR